MPWRKRGINSGGPLDVPSLRVLCKIKIFRLQGQITITKQAIPRGCQASNSNGAVLNRCSLGEVESRLATVRIVKPIGFERPLYPKDKVGKIQSLSTLMSIRMEQQRSAKGVRALMEMGTSL